MFIIGWLVILVLRANEVVVPGTVSLIVGVLAIAEAVLYGLILLINLFVIISALRD